MSRLRRRGWAVAVLLSAMAIVAGVAGLVWQHARSARPMYRDAFAKGDAQEWKAFGGTWELVNGVMRNDSDERGAKLLTGSSRWRNYSVDADVMLLGLGGDAGLLLRTSDEEQGVDAYTGYYAGLRTIDNSLVLGRAGHGWMETQRPLDLRKLEFKSLVWYHLRFLAYGCELAASVTAPNAERPITIADRDDSCVPAGRVGLRSYASGGLWRNVVVRPATEQDLVKMLATLPAKHEPESPASRSAGQTSWDFYGSSLRNGSPALPSSPNAIAISGLRLATLTKPIPATIRGVVALASPALCVQDLTGGIAVEQSRLEALRTGDALKVGDEVEVTGSVTRDASGVAIKDAMVRVLWEGTPPPAVSVTASQAATGAFDTTLIEVEGNLVRKQSGPDDAFTFSLDAGSQSFRAIVSHGRGEQLYRGLQPGSLLRVRGVAVSNPAYTHNLVPFAVLLRSIDDATVVAGPPWWSAGHLMAIGITLLLLVLVANLIYHRIESWRLRAVFAERERLAYEMHDTLSQSFAGIGFQLEAIREALPEREARLHGQLQLARELVRHSHDETRRSIAALRPDQLRAESLLEGLTVCADDLVAGGSVRILAKGAGETRGLPIRISDALYRIGQEVLANAVCHGHPSTIVIELVREGASVCLRISDNGRGFCPEEGVEGLGIRGMRKRAASIAAALEIRSRPGEGTEVSVRAALPAHAVLTSWPALLAKAAWRQIQSV